MKASKLSVLLFLAAGLVSCGGDTMVMNTEIHPDGTCCRELSFVTDTSGVSGYVVADTAYCTSVQRQWNDRRDSCLVRLAYRYPSVGRMSEHLPFRVAGQPLAAKGTLEKRFRWFHTDYTFTERYAPLAFSLPLPFTYAMTEDEASYWLTGSPDLYAGYSPYEVKDRLDALETQFWKYVRACMLCEAHALLADRYASIPDAPVSREVFVAERDSFVERSLREGYELWNEGRYFTAYFHSPAYENVLSGCLADTLEQRQMQYLSVWSFRVDYRLAMSGDAVLTDTDNGVLQDDGLHFLLTGPRLLAGGCTVSATFRTVNGWAFVLSLLVVLLAAGVIILPFVTKKVR